MSDWHEDAIRHKYAPLPEEGPRHRKRTKKAHVRSDHKHEYEEVVVDSRYAYTVRGDGRHKFYHKATRCRICGRVYDMRIRAFQDEPPAGMRMFRVDDLLDLFDKTLPEDKEVLGG